MISLGYQNILTLVMLYKLLTNSSVIEYVRLVTGVCFAELVYQVQCVDINQRKIEILNSGEMPFFENGLKN